MAEPRIVLGGAVVGVVAADAAVVPTGGAGSGGPAAVVAIELADETGTDELEPGSAAAGKETLPASIGWPWVL